MDSLLFLHNSLLSNYKEMHIPLTFISFAMIEGKMYKHFKSKDVFVLQASDKDWGNNKIYGALFHCQDFDFYRALLDAYHACSLSTLMCNHELDIHHRVSVDTTPIRFNTLDDLARLKYSEGENITAQTYVGNPNHPKISKRLGEYAQYRITDGISALHFKKLWEVIKCQTY